MSIRVGQLVRVVGAPVGAWWEEGVVIAIFDGMAIVEHSNGIRETYGLRQLEPVSVSTSSGTSTC